MSHTVWPTHSDITAKLATVGITLGASYGTAAIQQVLDSTIETVERVTKRSFVLETATRVFDGSDTGILEIDEYTAINTVWLVSYLGAPSPNVVMDGVVEVQQNKEPKTFIQIFQGSIPGYLRHYINKFPSGRSNIEINADWGYDVTIPNDLWLGVLLRSISLILKESSYDDIGVGFRNKWQEAGVQESRTFQDSAEFFGGSKGHFSTLLRRYKRPSSFIFRRMIKRLV